MMFKDYKYRVNRPLTSPKFSQAVNIMDAVCDSLYLLEAAMKVDSQFTN